MQQEASPPHAGALRPMIRIVITPAAFEAVLAARLLRFFGRRT